MSLTAMKKKILGDVQDQQQKAAERQKKRELAEQHKAELAQARKAQTELKNQLKGPDTEQIVGDIAGGLIGEVGFRALQMAFTKAGLTNALWYTVVPGVLGTAIYAVTYPKRNETMVRASLRGVGAWWTMVGIHDGISVYLGNSAENKAQAAQMMAQLQQLQQQNAALQQQAAQRQQQPGR